MKKFTPILISCFLIVGAAACQDTAKTTQSAPDNTNEAPQAPDAGAVEASKKDAQSQVRRDQLNADIRAREQRNNVTGGDTDRDKDDLKSQVRSKLEANIPNGQLVVDAEDNGTVTVSGTVANEQQLNKIEPLAKEIKGVKSVVNKATVAKPVN